VDWTDKVAVREYKRLQQRRYRGSTRTQERLNIDWSDPEQRRAYHRKQYKKHSLRWCQVVAKYLRLP